MPREWTTNASVVVVHYPQPIIWSHLSTTLHPHHPSILITPHTDTSCSELLKTLSLCSQWAFAAVYRDQRTWGRWRGTSD